MSILANWLAQQAPAALARKPSAPARRALHAIVRCRTPASGGHVYRCTACSRPHFAYHSCHHRACPRCGGADTAAWTQRQEARLLPVPYFLVTFTVPEQLRPAFAARPEVLHSVLFAQSAASLQQVAAEPRLLGADLGFVGVLHTWGRQLQLHPHVHYIVPGGGLRGDSWIPTRQSDWLLPVAKLAAVFRRRIAAALRERAPDLHAAVSDAVWRARWVVHCQPAGSGKSVVRYLARYVKRTAIGDERIVCLGEKNVTFRYTDSVTQQSKECTLSSEEFLRRYLQHVPVSSRHRVRYFGWMHPAAKARRAIVDTLLAVPIVVAPALPQPQWHLRCPHCEQFTLVRIARIEPTARAPPLAA